MLSDEELTAVRLSLQVGLCAVLLTLAPAILLGQLLARKTFPGKYLLEIVIDLPLVLPPVVTGYLLLVLLGPYGPIGRWLEVLGLRIVFTWFGAAVAAGIVSFPLLVRAIRIAWAGIDPRLEQVAATLGAGPWDVFFTISLPLARRGIAAGCLLAFARSLGEFGATILLAGNIEGQTRTLPLAVFSQINRPDGIAQSWRLVALSIALACLALACQTWLERGRREPEALAQAGASGPNGSGS